jgi:hypothetical protein
MAREQEIAGPDRKKNFRKPSENGRPVAGTLMEGQ